MGQGGDEAGLDRRIGSVLRNAWQPMLSVGAILISLVSFYEAHRANELTEMQLSDQRREKQAEQVRDRNEARQPLISEISRDGQTLSLKILSDTVSLRQVVVYFPKEIGWELSTSLGRPQEIRTADLPRAVEEMVDAVQGPNKVMILPVYVESTLIGKGEFYAEGGIYELAIKRNRLPDSPIEFEQFEFDLAVPPKGDGKAMLEKCWRLQHARPGHICEKLSELL